MTWKALAILTLISASIAGCGHRPISGNFCDIEKPTYLSSEEASHTTAERKRDIIIHNEYGEKVCGWKPLNR